MASWLLHGSQVVLLAQKYSASFTSGIDMIETNQANLVYTRLFLMPYMKPYGRRMSTIMFAETIHLACWDI